MTIAPADIPILSHLLDEVLELDAEAREAWFAALPAQDQRHADVLREMLATQAQTGVPERLSTLPRLAEDEATAQAGERIGPYRLLRPIGLGGMGSVWLAERADGSFERQVALKLPRLAWGAGLAQRMAREKAIGMRLEHPAIARLYDAGVDERGRPYLALEYIEGQTLDVWCEAQRLDIPARLKLFVQVVRAVAYAHGRLVVHRDLKPSNVLVSTDGRTHLLDFGIAKLLTNAASDDPDLTQQQGQVLTPHYASPEQIRGEAVTVASDIYSLGVLLYQVLSGTLPINPRRSSAAAVEDAVLQGDAPLASSRVKDGAMAKALRGDVDAIVAKAMKREPLERYATADALAQDIARHLRGETVSARPESTLYRLHKTIRRHWLGLAATAAVLVAVLGGAGVAIVQSLHASRSAERERIIREFVADVFRMSAQPGDAALHVAHADAFLERSARLVQSRFAEQPALQANLYATVGDAFAEMGANHLAAEYATRRLAALTLAHADNIERARALLQLASALLEQHFFENAEQRALQAASLADGNAELRLRSKVIAARSYAARDQLDRLQQVLPEMEAEVARVRPLVGATEAWTMGLRAALLAARNQRIEALPLLRAAIDRALLVEGADSLTAIELRLIAARSLAGTPAVNETDQVLAAALLALERRGPEGTIRAAIEAARFADYRYRATGQVSRQQALLTLNGARRQAASTGRVLPVELSAALDFHEANVLSNAGRVADAFPLMERAQAVLYPLAAGPGERRQIALAWGRTLAWTGRHVEADLWLRKGLEAAHQAGRATHPNTAGDYLWIALNLLMSGRHEDALRFLDTAPRFPAVPDDGDPTDFYNELIRLVRSQVLVDSGFAQKGLQAFPLALLRTPKKTRIAAWTIYGTALCANSRWTPGLDALQRARQYLEQEGDDRVAPWWVSLHAVTGRCAHGGGDRKRAVELANLARAALVAQPDVTVWVKVPLMALEHDLVLKRPPIGGRSRA